MAEEQTRNESNDEPAREEPTVVERWLAEQQAWQKTALTYLDSMVKNEDFLVHLGNAMRGSLLAGKPYPTAPAPGAAEPLNETDDRIDEILHALHQIQGEIRDLRVAVETLQQGSLQSIVAGSVAQGSETPPATPDAAPAAGGESVAPGADDPNASQAVPAEGPIGRPKQTATGAEGGDSV